MYNESSNLKGSKFIFFVGFVMLTLLITPPSTKAEDMRTKLFFKDLQKCSKYITSQHNALMTIFSSLSPEDVQLFNESMRGSRRVQLFDEKIDTGMKKLKKFGAYGPNGVKFDNNHSGGIPRNLLSQYPIHVGDYYEVILETYKIPAEDHALALERYSNYLIVLLDKIQELRSIQDEIGLNITSLPTINGINPGISTPCPTFFGKNPMGDTAEIFRGQVFNSWKRSTQRWMGLYSDPNVLTAQKLWFEYILTNDLAITRSNENYEETYMTELDLINKRLAAISTAPSVGADKQIAPKSSGNDITNRPATKKGDFKLNLPE